MTQRRHRLRWIPHSVSNLMHDNGINNPGELSPIIKIGRTTLYRAFDENWSGYATTDVLAAIAGTFRVPPSVLVTVETETSNGRAVNSTRPRTARAPRPARARAAS